MDEHIARMREGLKAGITVPQVALTGADSAVGPLMPTDPTASPLYAPFRSMSTTLPAEQRTRIESAGRAVIGEAVTPAYARFRTFLAGEYIPGARTTIAASALPDGAAYYQQLVKRFTTLPLTSEQVHATGLAEVARIRAEMQAVMRSTGFTGDFAAFLAMLRTDPRFYPKTGEQLLKEGAWIAKRMDANTALSLHECTTETDRYISWPGQALSYKIGELKIRQLRARAEKALGAKFDRRRFHDAVLANGSVPLPVVEQQIDAFIEAAR
jgi:uncharacterized protein (DUF885 family)